MTQYIYLFQTKELVDSKQPIYKFGKKTKPNLEEFYEYPVGTRMMKQISCDNCHVSEKKIISLFTVNYESKKLNEHRE